MRIDYHANRAFRFSNVFRFLVMINREEIALFPAIEVECSPARAGLRKVRLWSKAVLTTAKTRFRFTLDS